MNKQRFVNTLKNYHNISAEDREKLHELANEYPYSQIIHTLVAKANNDAKTSIAPATLHYAAMYNTDRHVLKAIITGKGTKTSVKIAPPQPATKKTKEVTTHQHVNTSTPSYNISTKTHPKITVSVDEKEGKGDNFRDKVWSDLRELERSKASYNSLFSTMASTSKKKETPTKKTGPAKKTVSKNIDAIPAKKQEVAKKTAKKKTTTPKAPKKTNTTVKKNVAAVTKKTTVSTTNKTIPTKKLRSTKNTKTPQKEQKKIIEKFIQKEPSISKKPILSTKEQQDLSISSTKFNEDLISENLAHILIDQGKKTKAIDIYKKLIWKFPQKKAYFAALIEDLKK